MMAYIVAVFDSFGLTVPEVKTETIFLSSKNMGRVIFLTKTTGEGCKQTVKYVYLGVTVCENANVTVETNRRVLLANLRLRRYGLPLYDEPTAPPRHNLQMLID